MFGVLSSCFVSLNSIYTKKVLPVVDDSVWTLNYYNNLNASLLFLPLMFIFGELPQTVFVTQISEPLFWLLMCLGGVMGVLIGFVTGMQIKVSIFITTSIFC
jgi:GDP-fucose transporter C1